MVKEVPCHYPATAQGAMVKEALPCTADLHHLFSSPCSGLWLGRDQPQSWKSHQVPAVLLQAGAAVLFIHPLFMRGTSPQGRNGLCSMLWASCCASQCSPCTPPPHLPVRARSRALGAVAEYVLPCLTPAPACCEVITMGLLLALAAMADEGQEPLSHLPHTAYATATRNHSSGGTT